jgi:hypothetical protein
MALIAELSRQPANLPAILEVAEELWSVTVPVPVAALFSFGPTVTVCTPASSFQVPLPPSESVPVAALPVFSFGPTVTVCTPESVESSGWSCLTALASDFACHPRLLSLRGMNDAIRRGLAPVASYSPSVLKFVRALASNPRNCSMLMDYLEILGTAFSKDCQSGICILHLLAAQASREGGSTLHRFNFIADVIHTITTLRQSNQSIIEGVSYPVVVCCVLRPPLHFITLLLSTLLSRKCSGCCVFLCPSTRTM